MLLFSLLAPLVSVLAAPALDAAGMMANGLAAQALNKKFRTLKATDACTGE